MPNGRAAMGSVFPREKAGVESVPCKMFTKVTGLAVRSSFVDACCAIVGASPWRCIPPGVIAAAAASPVDLRNDRRLAPQRLFDLLVTQVLLCLHRTSSRSQAGCPLTDWIVASGLPDAVAHEGWVVRGNVECLSCFRLFPPAAWSYSLAAVVFVFNPTPKPGSPPRVAAHLFSSNHLSGAGNARSHKTPSSFDGT